MRLELRNGSYFIIDNKHHADQEYDLRMWLYRNGFEGNVEYRPVYIFNHSYYIGTRQENGYLLNYRCLYYTNDAYKTEFIKIGTCIVSTGSHLLFLNPGEYEILQSGLKILPNE